MEIAAPLFQWLHEGETQIAALNHQTFKNEQLSGQETTPSMQLFSSTFSLPATQ